MSEIVYGHAGRIKADSRTDALSKIEAMYSQIISIVIYELQEENLYQYNVITEVAND